MEKVYELLWKEKYLEGLKHMKEIVSEKQYAELHILDLYYCEVGVEGALFLKELMMNKSLLFLEELNLSGNSLTDEGCCQIMDAMISGCLPNLVYLNLDDNKLTRTSICKLKSVYESKQCSKLQAISLNLNDIGSEGCVDLADVMEQSPSLWYKLTLKENGIHDEGFAVLASVLERKGSSMIDIDLSQNGISSKGINQFASLIAHGFLPNLTSLDLSYNYSDDMLSEFLDALGSGNCSVLRRLVISGMRMEADGCNHLKEVLLKKKLPQLHELLIAENNITEKGVLSILLALRDHSCPVRLLDLSWNCIGDAGAQFIINFLNGKSKTQLSILLLNQNDIAYKIIDLQNVLNKRNIHSPKLREQWL